MSNLVFFLLVGILLVLVYFMYNELTNIARKDRAVLISTGMKKLTPSFQKIIKNFVPNTSKVDFIEIGAGYSKVARMAAKSFNWKSVVALEVDWFPMLFAKLKNRLNKLPITFIEGDIFDYEAPKSGVIYSYMTNEILNNLHKDHFFDGTLLISLTFGLKDEEPVYLEEIGGFQKRIIVYDFRERISDRNSYT